MEYFSTLSQFQIAGIILQLITLPLLWMALRRWWWAKQSAHWPTVKGVVVEGLDFPLSRNIAFLYTYEVGGTAYQGNKPFFANSFKNLPKKKASALMEAYPEGKAVDVFYSPSSPKISTLEPGRKDGVMGAVVLLLMLFSLGAISYNNPAMITEVLDYFIH